MSHFGTSHLRTNGGSITGTVTNSSGVALSGICVDAYDGSPGSFPATSTTTGTHGTYSLTFSANGYYVVEFSTGCGNTGNYLNQWYEGAATEASATAVGVGDGSTTTGIDATLATGGSITGTVTNSSDAPVSGICVYVYSSNGYYVGNTKTGTGGTYSVIRLATGTYTVEFTGGCGSAGSYLNQWYKGASSQASATSVSVSAGSPTTEINVALAAGGSITGTVTNSSGTGLSGICVDVSSSSGYAGPAFTPTTGTSGAYSVTGLATGTYTVEFSTGCGNTGNYLDQWYKGASSQASATSVSVTAGSTTSGVDATLATG
ncbi:MAG: carboxypeptidase regulatory-like domain-containing protein, partial [Actinobacteria bacterium]|nr:carboxypeptidase regulatory-like domain-containing protein [Actinomycetota bacterium]